MAKVKESFFNRMLYAVAPSFALNRKQAQHKLDVLNWYGQNSGTGYGLSGAGNTPNLKGWYTSSSNADNDLIVNRDALVQRSRGLFTNSPLANGVLKDIAQNVTGGGLTLKSNINYEYLGISHEQARDLEKKLEFEFTTWADDAYNCDNEASKSFGDIQTLAMLSVLLSGDVFIVTPIKPRKNSTYDLKIKLIEADRVSDPLAKDPTKNILGGIEIDKDGMPIAYYLWNKLPFAPQFSKIEMPTCVRIPAFGEKTNRRNMLHLFTAERPEQRRGIPILSPMIETFKQLTDYSDAEITAAIISSMFSVFFTKENPTEQTLEKVGRNANNRMTGGATAPVPDDDDDYEQYKMQPGMIMTLKPGEKVEIANPSRPNTGFDGFVMSVLKQIAVGLGLPPEYMLKNMNSSYSASRAAILLAWEMFTTRRKWLVRGLCQPIYELWLSEAVAKGRVNMPGFFDNPMIKAAWCRANWIGSKPIQIDPKKDVEAAKMRIEESLSTREHEAVESSGMSFDDIITIRTNEEIQMDEVRRTEKPMYKGVLDVSQEMLKQNSKNE